MPNSTQSQVRAHTLSGQGAATLNSAAIQVQGPVVSVVTYISAVSGTPTLDISVEWSADGVNFMAADTTADTLAQITTAVGKAKQFTSKGSYCRVKAVVAGSTPSFTGTIDVVSWPPI